MTVAKLKMFTLPSPFAVIEAARTYFHAPQPVATPMACVRDLEPPIVDCSSYARLLQYQLDHQILTDVERKDTEMLDRVRSALYSD